MPVTQPRKDNKITSAGKRSVRYVDGQKQSWEGIVLGSGTGQTLNIRIPAQHRTVSNVPLGTAMNGSGATNKVFPRGTGGAA